MIVGLMVYAGIALLANGLGFMSDASTDEYWMLLGGAVALGVAAGTATRAVTK
jgi:hypothetical protein